jgi:hypothetical protein
MTVDFSITVREGTDDEDNVVIGSLREAWYRGVGHTQSRIEESSLSKSRQNGPLPNCFPWSTKLIGGRNEFEPSQIVKPGIELVQRGKEAEEAGVVRLIPADPKEIPQMSLGDPPFFYNAGMRELDLSEFGGVTGEIIANFCTLFVPLSRWKWVGSSRYRIVWRLSEARGDLSARAPHEFLMR